MGSRVRGEERRRSSALTPSLSNNSRLISKPIGAIAARPSRRVSSAKIRYEGLKGAQVPVEYELADFHPVILFLRCRPVGRESVPSKAVSLVPGTQSQARPNNGLISSRDGRARQVLQLVRRTGDREAGNVRRMASHGVQDVMRWKSRRPGRPALPKDLRELVAGWLAKTQRGVRSGSPKSYC